MAKKVAVLAVNPVNGMGLFQYLEAFFENGISFKTFAVADTKEIKTNSGVSITMDDIVANLKGKEGEYDAVVFSCGDAIPKFAENAGKSYNRDLLAVLKTFADKGKIIAGHCGAAVILDAAGAAEGKKVAVHPYAKPAVKKAIATEEKMEIDGNVYTAQTENTIWMLMPELLKALK